MKNNLSDALQWFAVYTRYRHEKSIQLALTKKGIECYVPVKKRIKNMGTDLQKSRNTAYKLLCFCTDKKER